MSYASRRLRQYAPGNEYIYSLPGTYRVIVMLPGTLALTNVPTDTTITVDRGTDFPLPFLVQHADGTPFNLTGCGALWTVKKSYTDLDAAALLTKSTGTVGGITIPTPANGIILVSLLEADTTEAYPYLKFPTFAGRKHSLKLFQSGGRPGIPIAQGLFLVKDFGVNATTTPP